MKLTFGKRPRKDGGKGQVGYFFFFHYRYRISIPFIEGQSEEDGIPDVEEEEDEDDGIVHETLFTFEAFESVWNSCFLV